MRCRQIKFRHSEQIDDDDGDDDEDEDEDEDEGWEGFTSRVV